MATPETSTVHRVTADGYRVFELLADIPSSGPIHTSYRILYLGGTFNPPSAGHLMDHSTRLPHWPFTRVYASVAEVEANPEHVGGCRPIHAVRQEYGGGFVERGPQWLIEGEPVSWIHDNRGAPLCRHAA